MSVVDLSSCLTVDATVRGAALDGVDVDVDTAARCAGCAGTCMWSWGPRASAVRFRSELPLEVGDRVRVSLPAHVLLSSTLLLHGVPLAALLAGGAVGGFLTRSDVGCLLGALAAVGFLSCMAPRIRERAERRIIEQVVVEPLP